MPLPAITWERGGPEGFLLGTQGRAAVEGGRNAVAAGNSLTTRVPVGAALSSLEACPVLPDRRRNPSQAHDVALFARSKGVGTSRDLGGGKSPCVRPDFCGRAEISKRSAAQEAIPAVREAR